MKLPAFVLKIIDAVSRLSERDRIVLLGVVTVVGTLSVFGGSYALVQGIDRTRRQVSYKSNELREILGMRDAYKQAQAQSAAFRSRLTSNNIRLVALVEEQSKAMGIEVSNITPRDIEPNAAGVSTQMVELRATKMSYDRLIAFLQKLEEQPSPVRILRLRVQNRYDEKDLVDAEMTVATYKAS